MFCAVVAHLLRRFKASQLSRQCCVDCLSHLLRSYGAFAAFTFHGQGRGPGTLQQGVFLDFDFAFLGTRQMATITSHISWCQQATSVLQQSVLASATSATFHPCKGKTLCVQSFSKFLDETSCIFLSHLPYLSYLSSSFHSWKWPLKILYAAQDAGQAAVRAGAFLVNAGNWGAERVPEIVGNNENHMKITWKIKHWKLVQVIQNGLETSWNWGCEFPGQAKSSENLGDFKGPERPPLLHQCSTRHCHYLSLVSLAELGCGRWFCEAPWGREAAQERLCVMKKYENNRILMNCAK